MVSITIPTLYFRFHGIDCVYSLLWHKYGISNIITTFSSIDLQPWYHDTKAISDVGEGLMDRLRERMDAMYAKMEHLLDREKDVQMKMCDLHDNVEAMKLEED